MLPIDGETQILGLLGCKIGYTLSPLIHNTSIRELDKNQVYLPLEIHSDALAGFLEAAVEMNMVGFNVTRPYKQLAARILNAPSRSINTIYRKEGQWAGVSTDSTGLEAALSRMGVSFSSFEKVVILGSGGVVAGIVEYLAESLGSTTQVEIHRRNDKDDEALRESGEALKSLDFVDLDVDSLARRVGGAAGETLLIQATSGPVSGDPLRELVPAMAGFFGYFVELSYNSFSALLEEARRRGLPCQNGLPMLIEQARQSQNYWWGVEGSFERIEESLAAHQ